MLSSAIAVATATTAASSAITLTSVIGLGVGGALVAVALVLLLSSKELISSSRLNSPRTQKALSLAIVPLLAVFTLNVAFMLFL
ncbi:MAG: hypothetical protein ACOX80_03590 [Methanomassiliicoccaceae archaeon]|jgi:hypothetical protein|nr:hypothetical protein [Methanomassiliicoccaceae archaeon]HOL08232.1 hypothetical protein [Methanomassiliicoccaceae archaeon]